MAAEKRIKHVKIRPSYHQMLEHLAEREHRGLGEQLEVLIRDGLGEDSGLTPRKRRAKS